MIKSHRSQALFAILTEKSRFSLKTEIYLLLIGSLYLAILAQFSISLKISPVPISGQTFGVGTLSLLLGSRRALLVFGFYLIEGAFGLPVFSHFRGGIVLGPTTGYLIGMGFACLVIGTLADRGAGKSFKKSFFACLAGSVCVLTSGLIGLSFFETSADLFSKGLYPFLPGDVIKNTLSATLVSLIYRKLK